MPRYEYKVVPAPRRPAKTRGRRNAEEKFAYALAEAMNDQAAEGWEYLRADTLPCDARSGLFGTKTIEQNMLVFRRAIEEQVVDPATQPVRAPRSETVRDLRPHRTLGPADRIDRPGAPKPA